MRSVEKMKKEIIEFEKFMANGIIQSYNAVTMNIENGPVRYTGSEPKKYILV